MVVPQELPKYAVSVRGEVGTEDIAWFFSPELARDYIKWKRGKQVTVTVKADAKQALGALSKASDDVRVIVQGFERLKIMDDYNRLRLGDAASELKAAIALTFARPPKITNTELQARLVNLQNRMEADSKFSNVPRTSKAQAEPSEERAITMQTDGNKWCALIGADLQVGISGFGDSPKQALLDLMNTPEFKKWDNDAMIF